MAISTEQYIDLLFKKAVGVAKTATAEQKSPSNEDIASPELLRGDIVWTESGQIGSSAQIIPGITRAYLETDTIECTFDDTIPPINGVRPTWLTGLTAWIPSSFGSTWPIKVYIDVPGAVNAQVTGTQIFNMGITGVDTTRVGEYYFDTQAGLLNFIGTTIPAIFIANPTYSIYIAGYRYVGLMGTTHLPGNTTIGNLFVNDTSITTTLTDGNIIIDATGTGITQITGTAGVVIPSGNTSQRPDPAEQGTLRYNNVSGVVEIYTGSAWVGTGGSIASITNQTIEGDGSTFTFTLDQVCTAASILVTINGINQTPNVDYAVTDELYITFTTTPIVSDTIQVRFISQITTITSITNVNGNTSISASASGNIDFKINNSTVAQITNSNILDISASHSLQLPTYTVAEANGIGNVATGQVIYVSNGATGSPCLAVYSGGNWKQVAIGNTITT
jgi:hypothetical protein